MVVILSNLRPLPKYQSPFYLTPTLVFDLKRLSSKAQVLEGCEQNTNKRPPFYITKTLLPNLDLKR